MGVLELTSDGEPKFKSGEDYAHWINRMHEIFHTKEGRTFEFCDCWEFLKVQPKFALQKAEVNNSKRNITRPQGNKKTKEDEKEEKVIDKVLKKIGADGTNAVGMGSSNGLDSIAGTLKDFIKIGETFMLGQLMGMEKGDIEHFGSVNEKRKYASSLLRLQSAQLERQAIELEEENARRRKIRKDNEEHVVESSSDDDDEAE